MIKTKQPHNSWAHHLKLLVLFLIILLSFFYSTYLSMVSAWIESETFTHGFLILPIVIWLIWRIKDVVLATTPTINFFGIPILFLLGGIWLISKYIGILALEQLSATAMIPVLIFTTLGWQTSRSMAFPLFFIMFMVPIGEELTPYLINVTADFTVFMINLVGIPVYREGTFFQLPTGNWSVVAACSGVRYLIASVTLGVLYAYLNYKSPLKRGLFILSSFIIPIIANGIRAFLIVMIGHFSDMQLATGIDHLIYGWVFFGIVIALMFYLGSFWHDEMEPNKSTTNVEAQPTSTPTLSTVIPVLVISFTLAIWPIKLLFEDQTTDFSHLGEIVVQSPNDWVNQPIQVESWKPAYQNLDRVYSTNFYNNQNEAVTLFIGYYAEQRQGAELDNYNNVLVVEKDETWRAIEDQSITLKHIDTVLPTVLIKGKGKELVTTYLYYVNGQWTSSKLKIKLLQAQARLTGAINDGAIVVFTSEQVKNNAYTRKLIQEFATKSLSSIKASLDNIQ